MAEEEQLPPPPLPPLSSGLAMASGGAMVDEEDAETETDTEPEPRRSGDTGFLRRLAGEDAIEVVAVAKGGMGVAWLCFLSG